MSYNFLHPQTIQDVDEFVSSFGTDLGKFGIA